MNRKSILKFLECFLERKALNNIAKEVFRKSIHLCSALLPFMMTKARLQVIVFLVFILLFYCASEILRLSGRDVFIVSAITKTAARKRDENKFVLGPVTLVLGILTAIFLWNPIPAAIGIYALAFGDGLASLSGKLFGRVKIPFTDGKTAAGSLTCFAAIFISTFITLYFSTEARYGINITLFALEIASVGMLIEVLPLKDMDNIVIPIVLGGIAQLQLFAM